MEGNVPRQENAMWRWRIGAAYLQTYRKAGQRPGTESHLRPPEEIDATDVLDRRHPSGPRTTRQQHPVLSPLAVSKAALAKQ